MKSSRSNSSVALAAQRRSVLTAALRVGVHPHAAVQLHAEGAVRAGDLPGVLVAQPVVGALHLLPVGQVLLEHPVLVADPVAVRGQPQRGHRVQVAGGQPTQAAVAQPGVGLAALQLLQVVPQLLQRLGGGVVDAQVQQRVPQRPPDQELERQVVDALGVLLEVARVGVGPLLGQPVAHRPRGAEVHVAPGGGRAVARQGVREVVLDAVLERVHASGAAPGVEDRAHLGNVREANNWFRRGPAGAWSGPRALPGVWRPARAGTAVVDCGSPGWYRKLARQVPAGKSEGPVRENPDTTHRKRDRGDGGFECARGGRRRGGRTAGPLKAGCLQAPVPRWHRSGWGWR